MSLNLQKNHEPRILIFLQRYYLYIMHYAAKLFLNIHPLFSPQGEMINHSSKTDYPFRKPQAVSLKAHGPVLFQFFMRKQLTDVFLLWVSGHYLCIAPWLVFILQYSFSITNTVSPNSFMGGSAGSDIFCHSLSGFRFFTTLYPRQIHFN